MLKDKKQTKRELKAKAAVELQRSKKMDEDNDDYLGNDDVITEKKEDGLATGADSSENDEDLEEEREIQKIMKE